MLYALYFSIVLLDILFVCCKKERTKLYISNTKYNYFMCSVTEDYDDDDGECENASSVTVAVLSGPTLRLGD
jgi:hypothetical protein